MGYIIMSVRESYRKQRQKYLKKIAAAENNMDEDDLELFAEFQTLRDRANITIGLKNG